MLEKIAHGESAAEGAGTGSGSDANCSRYCLAVRKRSATSSKGHR